MERTTKLTLLALLGATLALYGCDGDDGDPDSGMMMVDSGGGTDGSLTQAVGLPTLDSLGIAGTGITKLCHDDVGTYMNTVAMLQLVRFRHPSGTGRTSLGCQVHSPSGWHLYRRLPARKAPCWHHRRLHTR